MTRYRDQEEQALAQFNPWFTATGPLFDSSVKLTDTLCTRAMAVASELTDFTLSRVQEDIRLPQKLAHCHSPQDVQKTWMEFWNTAFDQYRSEWTRLANINMKPLPLPTADELVGAEHKVRAAA